MHGTTYAESAPFPAGRTSRREALALRALRLELDHYREVADFDAYLYAAHEAEELARAAGEGRPGARADLLALRSRLRRVLRSEEVAG